MDKLINNLISRRKFLKDLGILSSMLILMNTGGCESILESIRNRPIRRRISSSAASLAALEIYKDAISQMKALPLSDLRNWTNQANIHGIPGEFTNCQHRSWYFFPWHRLYVYHFEQICKTLTGEESFGLPYWNWQLDTSVPSYFWDEASQLYLDGRSADSADTISDGITDSETMEDILADDNFNTFGGTSTGISGAIESTPHNSVHTFVGGRMADGDSPIDPIFWTHHCMVDYCWYVWNLCREHDNPDDATWTTRTFPGNFVDGSGDPVALSVGSTVLMPFLSYRYESSTIGDSDCDPFFRKSKAELKSLKDRIEKGGKVQFKPRVSFPIPREKSFKILDPLSLSLSVKTEEFKRVFSTTEAERVLVNISFENSPVGSDFFVRLYINKPDANSQTGTKDIHYAGSFAFFGNDKSSHHGNIVHSPSFLVDITNTLVDLNKNNLLSESENINLQLVAVPIRKDAKITDQTLRFKNPEILISPLSVKNNK